MNVEQLIEEGWKKHKAEAGIRSDAGFEAFRFGVRHALAAMFPVVKVEELEKGRYWVRLKGSDEWMACHAFQFDYPRSCQFTNCELRDIDEILAARRPRNWGSGET